MVSPDSLLKVKVIVKLMIYVVRTRTGPKNLVQMGMDQCVKPSRCKTLTAYQWLYNVVDSRRGFVTQSVGKW
jgi:hypothetical protein